MTTETGLARAKVGINREKEDSENGAPRARERKGESRR